MAERIQKMLANYGIGSRRMIERWIEQGRIVVNGKPAQLGDLLNGQEAIRVDGRILSRRRGQRLKAKSVLAYYKPVGQICTRDDPDKRPTIFSHIERPEQGRWVSVGRLDINTSGLLLLTTNGELAHRLMHPSYGIQREYSVRLFGELTATHYKILTRGVRLDDGIARFDKVTYSGGSGKNVWYRVRLGEGRYREIRRIFEAVDCRVSRLIRVRYGPISLGDLRRGRSRRLSPKEVQALHTAVGL